MEATKKSFKNIIRILEKQALSIEDINKLVNFINSIEGLSPYLSSASFLSLDEIAEHLILNIYRNRQIIFHKGEHSDKLFIIVKGHVVLYDADNNQQFVLVNTLHTGSILGERGLIRNLPRSLTAVAKKTTILISLDVLRFRSIIESQLTTNIEEKIDFIDKKFPKASGLKSYDKEKLAFCINIKQYKKDDIIIEENKISDYLMFIFSGECILIKTIGFSRIKVSCIGSGCLIAEECIFLNKPSQFTYKASSKNVKLYFIKKQYFFIQASKDLIKQFNSICLEKLKTRGNMVEGAKRIAMNNSYTVELQKNQFPQAIPKIRMRLSDSLKKLQSKDLPTLNNSQRIKNNKEKLTKLRERVLVNRSHNNSGNIFFDSTFY